MAWVCKICSSNNEDASKVCIICDTPKMDKCICTLTRQRVLELHLSGDVVIPEQFNVIGECAFKDRLDIRTVIAHDNVEKIEKQAFAGCSNLEKVVAKNLNSIQSQAFLNCVKLTSISRPIAKHIASDAFHLSYTTKPKETQPIIDSYRYMTGVKTTKKSSQKSFHKWFARFLLLLMGGGILAALVSLFL